MAKKTPAQEATYEDKEAEKKAKKLEALRELNEKKKAAKLMIRTNIDAIKEALQVLENYDEITAAIQRVAGSGQQGRAPRIPGARKTATHKIVADFIAEQGGQVKEDEIWTKFHLGRTEMRNVIKKSVKMPGEDRVWIRFEMEDEFNGVYSIVSTGPDIPDGWDGPLPVGNIDLDD
ncbi:MAG: hypothetical protein A4E71_02654 [Smithella sp. PtaU1.Bin162]|nr:MAG: hypothetical protein A4E71_02654 [Smithella sp. PtaU1.Bin162]